MAVFPTPGGPISCHEKNCEMAKHCPINGLTTGFDFVLRDKTRRKGAMLAHKIELQEGLPTLYCPPNLYDSNSTKQFFRAKRQARTIVSTNSRIKLPLLRQLRQIHALRTNSHQPQKLDRAEQTTHIFFQRLAFLVLRAHTKRRKATLRWPAAHAPATDPIRIVPAHRMWQPWDSHTCRWND